MIDINDDTLDRLAEKVARRLEQGKQPATRDGWRELMANDPAAFGRLLDAGQVPPDFLAVKEETDDA